MDDVFASLLGSNGSPGVLSNLGAVGDKLAKTSDSWTSVIGPYVGAPGKVPTPAPAPHATLPARGISLSSVIAGVAAVALLAYLVIRGR